jgi:hypothetical protein
VGCRHIGFFAVKICQDLLSRQGAHSLGQCEYIVDLVRLFRLPTLHVLVKALLGLIEKRLNGSIEWLTLLSLL